MTTDTTPTDAPAAPKALPAELDPRQLMDKVLEQQRGKMIERGELRFASAGAHARPASGWNLQTFRDHVKRNTPSVPEFASASAPMAWLKIAKDDISRHEGNTIYAYHGTLSPHRNPRSPWVRPGDPVGSEEISVGYGFNLTQPDGRRFYEEALKGAEAPSYDDVVNGRKPISRPNASALQEFMILQKNATLDRQLGGTPVRDHQRAALVSMLYQGVGIKSVVDAIKDGKPDSQIADLIRATGDRRFKSRRNLEASRFLGAQAQAYFDNSTNQLPGRTAGAGGPVTR